MRIEALAGPERSSYAGPQLGPERAALAWPGQRKIDETLETVPRGKRASTAVLSMTGAREATTASSGSNGLSSQSGDRARPRSDAAWRWCVDSSRRADDLLGRLSERTVGKFKKLDFEMSARPRHPAQDERILM